MKLTKRNQLGYALLGNGIEKPASSFLEAAESHLDEKKQAPLLIEEHMKLLDEYSWSDCPDYEALKELDRIFESVPKDLQIFFECWPNGSVALDSRNPITSSTDKEHLRQWLETLEQHHRIHSIKIEMDREKKRVGYLTWKWWRWCDRRNGTRRAEERIGKRVQERMVRDGENVM